MNTADLNRRLESLIRLGTIAQVDHAARRLRVKTGELLTSWLPWPTEIGRNFIHWRPLRVGTQVVLASPSGDPAQAVIIGMLYTRSIDLPNDEPDVDLIQFDDGSHISHNAKTGQVRVHAAGDLHLTAEGNVLIKGERVDIN